MSEKESLARKTAAAIEAFKSQRLRWVTGRSQVKVEIDEERYQKVVDAIMRDEIERCMIIGAIKEKGPLTVEEISQLIGLQPSRIVQHIIALRMKGAIGEAGEKDNQYLYRLI
jgi:DNA-binding transcriptional ArsR family regulator